MRGSPSRWTIGVAVVLVVMIATSIVLRRAAREPAVRSGGAPTVESAPAAASAPADASGVAEAEASRLDGIAGDAQPAPPDDPYAYPGKDMIEPGAAWASVDFDAIRKALPDNTYWRTAYPTKDPEVLKAREVEREHWSAQSAKVVSSTATAEEVDEYYAHRQKTSEDYLEFIVYLLTNYGYQIPMRDVAALKLAAEMHNARLEEIPRQLAEAQQRREEHEAARRAWQEQQQAFNADPAAAASR